MNEIQGRICYGHLLFVEFQTLNLKKTICNILADFYQKGSLAVN